MLNRPMRPATAADVGRRIEISNTGDFDTDEWCHLRAIGAKGRYICDHGKDFEFARVPILPEEADPDKNPDKVSGLAAPIVTIRRKLEAGGLAEAEQAILLDGKLYPIAWVKSSPGVLPEQVEIV